MAFDPQLKSAYAPMLWAIERLVAPTRKRHAVRCIELPVILEDRAVAAAVAEHKAWFFQEKDTHGSVIDYKLAVHGQLKLVPEGEVRQALATDYAQMREAGVLLNDVASFAELMQSCAEIGARINQAAPPL